MSPTRERDLRAARNEDLFRRLNERLHVLTQFGSPEDGAEDGQPQRERFVCECASASCSQVVELTPGEYTAVREGARRFLVYPDASHTLPDVERVVRRHRRYWVVEKVGDAGDAAEALDERPVDPL
jgi:hypothetical protein